MRHVSTIIMADAYGQVGPMSQLILCLYITFNSVSSRIIPIGAID